MLNNTSTEQISFLLLVLFSFFVPFLVQLIIVRGLGRYKEKSLRQKGAIISILIGFFPIGLLFIIWFLLFATWGWMDFIWSGFYLFLVYLLLAYVYFHIFNMSETARRIRILAEGHQVGRIVKDEMIQNYPEEQMIAIRIDRLIALEEIKLEGERHLVDRGQLLIPARLVFAFRKILFPHERESDL